MGMYMSPSTPFVRCYRPVLFSLQEHVSNMCSLRDRSKQYWLLIDRSIQYVNGAWSITVVRCRRVAVRPQRVSLFNDLFPRTP